MCVFFVGMGEEFIGNGWSGYVGGGEVMVFVVYYVY